MESGGRKSLSGSDTGAEPGPRVMERPHEPDIAYNYIHTHVLQLKNSFLQAVQNVTLRRVFFCQRALYTIVNPTQPPKEVFESLQIAKPNVADG